MENLASIWERGAVFADLASPDDLEVDELGSRQIKDQRAVATVSCGSGGVVGDYVPFYYSARSPMLYLAYRENPLSPFKKGQRGLAHLVAHATDIADAGLPYALTDRNAALSLARQSDDLADLDDLVDWTLQQQQYWHDTDAEPDRMERRMCEFLVHERFPVELILGIVVIDEEMMERVSVTLAGYHHPTVLVKRDWYY
ncbi:MAG: DUF4433 domain-containing protein [Acidimicrobiia bacterium]